MEKNPDQNERFQKALKDKKFGRRDQSCPEMTAEEMAPWYAERIASAGISKALVVSVIPDSQYMRDFIVAARGHVQALCNVDPRSPDAADSAIRRDGPWLPGRQAAAGQQGLSALGCGSVARSSNAPAS